MNKDDRQLGTPFVNYTDTKSDIEALSGIREGATAVATDNPTAPFGIYINSGWHWYATGSVGGVISAQDEGVAQGTFTTLNVVGSNVDISVSGSVARLFVTGSASGSSLNLQDEGVPLGTPGIVNFVGNNVEVTVSGSVARVFITGSTSAYIPESGWTSVTATWTRTGNHTFTVSGDVTATYRKGTKVRYKDGGAFEYGVVKSSSYSSPNTTVTLFENTDYAMAAATITDTYISYIENPEGWVDWFNWSPTYGGFSSAPPTNFAQLRVQNNTIFLTVDTGQGTSNANSFTITNAPVAPTTTNGLPLGAMRDNSVVLTTAGRIVHTSGSTTLTLRTDMSSGVWTAGGTKAVSFFIFYPF